MEHDDPPDACRPVAGSPSCGPARPKVALQARLVPSEAAREDTNRRQWDVRVPTVRAEDDMSPSWNTARPALLDLTCVNDGRTHAITSIEFEHGLTAGTGRYRAACGTEVVAASLGSRPGPPLSRLRRTPSETRNSPAVIPTGHLVRTLQSPHMSLSSRTLQSRKQGIVDRRFLTRKTGLQLESISWAHLRAIIASGWLIRGFRSGAAAANGSCHAVGRSPRRRAMRLASLVDSCRRWASLAWLGGTYRGLCRRSRPATPLRR